MDRLKSRVLAVTLLDRCQGSADHMGREILVPDERFVPAGRRSCERPYDGT